MSLTAQEDLKPIEYNLNLIEDSDGGTFVYGVHYFSDNCTVETAGGNQRIQFGAAAGQEGGGENQMEHAHFISPHSTIFAVFTFNSDLGLNEHKSATSQRQHSGVRALHT